MSHPGPPGGPGPGPPPQFSPLGGAPAGPDLSKLADPKAWQLWVKLGIGLFAAGLVIAGLGGLFAANHMQTLGNFFRIPGSVLLAVGVAAAAFESEEMSHGVRLAAVIVAGFMSLFIL